MSPFLGISRRENRRTGRRIDETRRSRAEACDARTNKTNKTNETQTRGAAAGRRRDGRSMAVAAPRPRDSRPRGPAAPLSLAGASVAFPPPGSPTRQPNPAHSPAAPPTGTLGRPLRQRPPAIAWRLVSWHSLRWAFSGRDSTLTTLQNLLQSFC